MDRRQFLKMTAATTLAAPGLVRATAPMIDPLEDALWKRVRDDYPITKELYYMNNGTMGPSPLPVTRTVTDRIERTDRTGEYGGNYEQVREALARFVGTTPETIAFTHNVSEAISIVSSGVKLKEGDEVILTDQEHAGNMVPWLARAKRDGIVLKFVKLVPDDAALLGDFEAAITDRTRVIAVPHLTCTTGQLLPIPELAALARRRGIWTMADGAHPPGMLRVNVRDLGVDAYTSCGHKWICGPKGIGFLFIRPELMEQTIPTWSGAEADKHWDYEGNLEWLPAASRYDFATQNYALFEGLQRAIEYQEQIGTERIESRIVLLTHLLRQRLSEKLSGEFDYLTPATSVTGLTTIKLRNVQYQEFANTMLSKHKIRTRVVPESKLDANRFSLHIYHSTDDVEYFVDSAVETIRTLRAGGK